MHPPVNYFKENILEVLTSYLQALWKSEPHSPQRTPLHYSQPWSIIFKNHQTPLCCKGIKINRTQTQICLINTCINHPPCSQEQHELYQKAHWWSTSSPKVLLLRLIILNHVPPPTSAIISYTNAIPTSSLPFFMLLTIHSLPNWPPLLALSSLTSMSSSSSHHHAYPWSWDPTTTTHPCKL